MKYLRWHGDFPGICFSSLSVSHEGSCAKVFNSSYLPGFQPENSKQSHQSSPTWPGSRTQWYASVTDGACREREREIERDALIGCSTQAWCKLCHKVLYSLPKSTVPWYKWKAANVFSSFFFAHEWRLRGYRWMWDHSDSHLLKSPREVTGCCVAGCHWITTTAAFSF